MSVGCFGTRGEASDRGELTEVVGGLQRGGVRKSQGPDVIHVLPFDPERCSAGHEGREQRAGPHHAVELRSGGEHVLEVVEHQRRLPIAQNRVQVVDGRTGRLGHTQRSGDGRGDQDRLARRRQRHEDDPVGVVDGEIGRELQRKTRIADGAAAGGVAALLLTAGRERSVSEQTATPSTATTYAPSVYAEIIGHKFAVAASDYNLQLARITFDPESSVPPPHIPATRSPTSSTARMCTPCSRDRP